LNTIASKSLSTSISSCKNKNEIKRSVLKKKWKKWKKWKKCHLETKYLMPKGCFVQPFIKLGIRKPKLGEIFGLS
jgi:hypothetical protein